jgi:glycosidase
LGGDPGLEFRGFVEAAHRFGFRVVLEFVFRTAAKDSDWIAEHPEWFYWIRENLPARAPGSANELSYGSPLFSREELDAIRRDVTDHKMDNLLPPHAAYRKMFMPPPSASSVRIVEGRYVGEAPDGTLVKIPGAFADWPPDDNQPPWGDVTYLRMYDHPDFNYIAYNTIRMYDSRLARPENINTSLWEKIVGIIPFFQRQFRIDGVMIDMGHALPPELKREIIRKARSVDPDFAFWDENFSITRKSREEGYNAVFGYLWWDEHHLSKLRTFIKRCSMEGFPIPFFATPENHNTPRAASRPGGTMFSQWSWVVNQFLPGIPFLHSGFELGETHPINTGLDFSPADLSRFSSEKLPLFSAHAFPWNSRSRFPLFVRKVAGIRSRYADLLENRDPGSFTLIDQDNPSVIAVVRKSRSGRKQMGLLANGNFVQPEQVTFHLDTAKNSIKDLVAGGRQIVTDRRLSVKLQPGQCMVFEL